MIRVLIADDHAAVRAGVRAVLDMTDDIDVIGEASDGQSAVAQAAALEPDVVLMDIRMPGVDGIAGTAQLTDRGIPVLILTTFAVDDYVDGALAAGAAGYLLKTAEPEDIADGVRRVAAGEGVLSPEVTRRVLEKARATPSRTEHPGLEELTPREKEILGALGEGLSNAQICERFFISEPTAKSHVSRVLTKLGAPTRMRAAVIARDAGIS
ncbi:response regulator [Microbacterium amylolyticum]|uniref:DNA-binding NarL/FixJ family response regulator n=1 Tax=Microbacterium amylolyticum TaxID=936337 RepID=A0ABS4ZIV8_9MICO|nr:response regulator transcription factor [Microbacterium amylolyticum]MBP2436968.1 DNA-binding NarL/FixJ family response regulator [Microbacterium amylolyticum]